MPENQDILVSSDGSHTLNAPLFDETYHSKHGAMTESQMVFIDAGLNYTLNLRPHQISIFEMGFGTGLNALLAFDWSQKNNIAIQYVTVEAYPISKDIYEQLNYGQLLGASDIFNALHQVEWGKTNVISDNFTLTKYQTFIEDFNTDDRFDVIFYDAFAPASQPHLWDMGMMKKMHSILKDDGILVSYCAQGAFKRHLKAVGFKIEALPGPPGKREITRALKSL